MRKKIVAGNWKMNKTPSEAVELVNMLKPLCVDCWYAEYHFVRMKMLT